VQTAEQNLQTTERPHPPNAIELAREYYDDVYRFCLRRVGADHAPDASQETFLTAQKALKKFEGRSTVKTWLLGIAINECRRLMRTRRIEMPLLDIQATESPEKQLLDRHALRDALNRLTPEHREVVLMHEVEQLTYTEIAELLGIPSGTVKSRLYHAFLNLRTAMGGVA
jgi:RNA polymerase sigma-70 factor (ECF subfamily)